MSGYRTKVIHEAGFAAEVEVEVLDSDGAWSPYLSLADAEKLDGVRVALRQGDVKAASRLGRIFQLLPVSA